MIEENVYKFYSGIVMTPTGRVKKSWPKTREGDVAADKMSEEGERGVADVMFRGLKGELEEPLDLELPEDLTNETHFPMTTKQLFECGMLSKEDEKEVQLRGNDVIYIPREMYEKRQKLTPEYFKDNWELCVQVKSQPWSLKYKAITLEAFTDICYHKNKVLDLNKPHFLKAGLNKTDAKWTAYIVGGGTILFMKTNELRKIMYEKQLKYIGTVWRGDEKTKRAIGNATNILPLLSSGMAQPVSVSEVFRTYFGQLTNAQPWKHETVDDYSWELSVQDWTVSTLKTYLAGGISAVDNELVRGKKYDY
ncbi:MAG: hypothetical protein ACRCZ2_08725 [Fusobacteriaceae bacterium]